MSIKVLMSEAIGLMFLINFFISTNVPEPECPLVMFFKEAN